MTAAAPSMALPPTPGRIRLVAAVKAAIERGAASVPSLKPTAVYLTATDANAADYRWQHFDKSDPPRCLGLPVRLILGAGRSRLYCRGGIALSLHGNLNPKQKQKVQP